MYISLQVHHVPPRGRLPVLRVPGLVQGPPVGAAQDLRLHLDGLGQDQGHRSGINAIGESYTFFFFCQ